ncbi:MAG TPA: phosphatase PAP2 family protein [Verrucomicrobiae bacterium]|jgi:membrane-associated phospholipid phosphatase|nr:phosphatase PAP2 family protein [Verrucomicrobiae bacterium]
MRFPDSGRRPLLATAITLAVIRFSVVYLDRPVAQAMRGVPPWLRDLAEWVTGFGRSDRYLIPLLLVILLLAFASRSLAGEHRRAAARFWAWRGAFVWLAMALSGLLNDVVKLLAGRPRPTAGDAGSAPFTFDYAFQSFPSGHTAIAFALAFSLSLFWPRWRLPLLAFALAVAASRVIISAHYPADVIGGALVAWLTVAWLARFFADRRLVFQPDSEGRPVPRPAPDGIITPP